MLYVHAIGEKGGAEKKGPGKIRARKKAEKKGNWREIRRKHQTIQTRGREKKSTVAQRLTTEIKVARIKTGGHFESREAGK